MGEANLICHGGWSLRGEICGHPGLKCVCISAKVAEPVEGSISARVAEPVGASVSARVAEPRGGRGISQSG